jgi:hypothetical protein
MQLRLVNNFVANINDFVASINYLTKVPEYIPTNGRLFPTLNIALATQCRGVEVLGSSFSSGATFMIPEEQLTGVEGFVD